MSGPAGVQVLMTESEWYESLRKDDVWWEWKMRVGIEKDTDCFCVFFELTTDSKAPTHVVIFLCV